MDSVQSDKALSESFFAHHHPHRLLKAAARSCPVVFVPLIARSHAAMPSSALRRSPTNLQRSRSAWASADVELKNISDAAKEAAKSTEKRICPPIIAA